MERPITALRQGWGMTGESRYKEVIQIVSTLSCRAQVVVAVNRREETHLVPHRGGEHRTCQLTYQEIGNTGSSEPK